MRTETSARGTFVAETAGDNTGAGVNVYVETLATDAAAALEV
jgi:hypothetical protein